VSGEDHGDAVTRLARALERIESLLPADVEPDYAAFLAFRWRKRRYLGLERGDLEPVAHPALIPFEDLKHVDSQ
jgi:predicted AAA+ superfamily ATPase